MLNNGAASAGGSGPAPAAAHAPRAQPTVTPADIAQQWAASPASSGPKDTLLHPPPAPPPASASRQPSAPSSQPSAAARDAPSFAYPAKRSTLGGYVSPPPARLQPAAAPQRLLSPGSNAASPSTPTDPFRSGVAAGLAPAASPGSHASVGAGSSHAAVTPGSDVSMADATPAYGRHQQLASRQLAETLEREAPGALPASATLRGSQVLHAPCYRPT